MKVVRTKVEVLPLDQSKCESNVVTNESYNRHRTETYQKDCWTITKEFSENRSTWQGSSSVFISRSINKHNNNNGQTEFASNSYSLFNGVVTINSNRGTTKQFKECDMTVEDWQFNLTMDED